MQIEIKRAESLAAELSSYVSSRLKQYPGALVIAAVAPLEYRLRAGSHSPHAKWIDALNTLARELPPAPADCERELYRLAAAALGGMGIVEQCCREFEAQKLVDAAADELRRIRNQPAEDAARKAMFAEAATHREKHRALWNPANFDAMEAQAKRTILDLYGKAQSPNDRSILANAFETLASLPFLRELSPVALG